MEKYTHVEIMIDRRMVKYKIDGTDYVDKPNLTKATLERLAKLRLEGDPEAYGEELCKVTFRGKAEHGLAYIRHETSRNFRLCLNIYTDDPDLHSLWWECLVHPEYKNLKMSRLTRTPLSRYLDQTGTGKTKPVKNEKLKVLVVVSNPKGLGEVSSGWEHLKPIDEKEEVGLIKDVFKELEHLVEYKILTEKASGEEISLALFNGKYHVLHIVAHGGFKNNQGYLLLEDDKKERVAAINDESINDILLNAGELRIVLLCSCHTAAHSKFSPFVGMAQKIVEGGRPAVIAMQDRLSKKTAHTFTKIFYKAFLEYPQTLGHVDASVNLARNQVSLNQTKYWDWAIPVLYLHGDGLMYQPPRPNISRPDLVGGTILARERIKEPIRNSEIPVNRSDFQQLMDGERPDWMNWNASFDPVMRQENRFISGLTQAIKYQQPFDPQITWQQGGTNIRISGQDMPKITKLPGK